MSAHSDANDNPQIGDGEETIDDMELAYREALRSIDEAELQVGSALMELAGDDDEAEVSESDEEAAFASIGDALASDLATEAELPAKAVDPGDRSVRVSPRAVIEGALFVGGDVALTARRLAALIGQETETRLAVRLIDSLNEDYASENRPYEIRLHEGGFRMELREDFADVQARVFGLGPREVRLSPEVLEVLAFVAYNQPVTPSDFSQISQPKAQNLVRQLIRLQLVDVERTGKRRSDVAYRTSARFLSLFALESLDDLPQADIFSFK